MGNTILRATTLALAIAWMHPPMPAAATAVDPTPIYDSYGYRALQVYGTEAEFEEIAGASDADHPMLLSGDDAWLTNVVIGFPFTFYGRTYQSLALSSNGLIQFGGGIEMSYTATDSLASKLAVDAPSIAAWWNDWMPERDAVTGMPVDDTGVFTALRGFSPNRRLIVEWRRLHRSGEVATPITFQAVLYEGSNTVVTRYKNVRLHDAWQTDGVSAGQGANVGIRDTSPRGAVLQWLYNNPVLSDGEAIRFELDPGRPTITSLSPAGVPAGASGLSLTVHGSGFTDASIIYWNALPLPTHMVSSSELTTTVPDANLAVPETAFVRAGPLPTSNTAQFDVGPYAPNYPGWDQSIGAGRSRFLFGYDVPDATFLYRLRPAGLPGAPWSDTTPTGLVGELGHIIYSLPEMEPEADYEVQFAVSRDMGFGVTQTSPWSDTVPFTTGLLAMGDVTVSRMPGELNLIGWRNASLRATHVRITTYEAKRSDTGEFYWDYVGDTDVPAGLPGTSQAYLDPTSLAGKWHRYELTAITMPAAAPLQSFTQDAVLGVPTAADDLYTATADTELDCDAQHGVFANDTGVGGPQSSVELQGTVYDNPTHGTLVFGSDGSFVYRPDPGFVGADTFTYAADAYGAQSNIATVTIQVVASVPTLTSISPATVNAGCGAVTITLTGAGFDSNCTAYWNDTTPLATVYQSPTRLLAVVPASLTENAAAGTIFVKQTVSGGTSEAKPFAVLGAPRIVIDGLEATRLPSGSIKVSYTITNLGQTAPSLSLTLARLVGSATRNVSLAVNVGNMDYGQSYSGAVTFPATPGTSAMFRLYGTYTGASFNIGKQVDLLAP